MAANATSMPRRNNRKAFIIAAVFGVIAAFLTLMYLRNAKSEGNKSLATATVVVAVRDIPERTKIREGMVEVKEVPIDGMHNLALTEKQAAIGQITRVPIAEGEQILSNKVADQIRDVGFSANIPEGKRGVAVGVTEVVATGGHVGVGDFVDVIGVFEVFDPNVKTAFGTGNGQAEKAKVFTSATILQNIQVLAVAQKSDPEVQTAGKVGDASKRDTTAALKSVTLAVTPEQAEKLFMAEEVGKLRLSLRPFGEDEQRKVVPVYNSLDQIVGQ